MPKNKSIAILGPTASGKTNLAVLLADKLNGEIISVDSRQVYKGMDIGTGKDLKEYTVNNRHIPYHLIDIVEAGSKYNLAQFLDDAKKATDVIQSNNHIPIFCGGTGLYMEALLLDYNYTAIPPNISLRERLRNFELTELQDLISNYDRQNLKLDVDTKKRAIRAIEMLEFVKQHPANIKPQQDKLNEFIVVGIDIDRDTRRERITNRLNARLEEGLIKEVEVLLNNGITFETLIYYGLEYKYVSFYLQGKLNFDDMRQKLNTEIHRFAKRQMTWFRKMQKKGIQINWIPNTLNQTEKVEYVLDLYTQH